MKKYVQNVGKKENYQKAAFGKTNLLGTSFYSLQCWTRQKGKTRSCDWCRWVILWIVQYVSSFYDPCVFREKWEGDFALGPLPVKPHMTGSILPTWLFLPPIYGARGGGAQEEKCEKGCFELREEWRVHSAAEKQRWQGDGNSSCPDGEHVCLLGKAASLEDSYLNHFIFFLSVCSVMKAFLGINKWELLGSFQLRKLSKFFVGS